jgi:hypothetical protein
MPRMERKGSAGQSGNSIACQRHQRGTVLATVAQPMNRKCTLALLIYLTFDLCNPFVGGAFRFSADESAEVTQVKRDGKTMVTASTAGGPAAPVSDRLPVRPQWARAIGRVGIVNLWLAGLRHNIDSKQDSPPPSEDDH